MKRREKVKMKVLPFVLLACAFSQNSSAQVANGNFSSGGASWNWSDAVFPVNIFVSCNNAGYSAYSPLLNQDTPNIGFAPASGRVAMVTSFPPYGTGSWSMCRKIEQTVFVPQGGSLSFAYKIGQQEASGSRPLVSATLDVYVTDLSTNQTLRLFTASGTSVRGACGTWCPVYTAKTLSLSNYWGKTVKITFRGATGLSNNQTMSSPVYIDNVAVQ